jgi:hypothetical protein
MVVRTRRQRILQAMGLYAAAAALIAYFGFHAYHGEHGIHAKQQFLEQIVELNGQLTALRKEKAEVARLSRDAADPPLRGEGRPDVRHGPHRRLLPPLYRPGSGGRRHADGAPRTATSSSPAIATTATCWPCGMDPKGVMAELTGRRGGLSKLARQGRLHAHVLEREALLRRPRHRRRAGVARHRPRLRQPSYRGNGTVS